MIDFIYAALAVYALAYSISRLDGPFDAFARLRNAVGQRTWVGRGLYCPMCVAYWLSWAAAATLDYAGAADYVILSLALMGVTVVLTLLLDR